MKCYARHTLALLYPLFLLSFLLSSGAFAATNQHTDHSQTPHWGYSGSSGPGEWGKMSEAYALCGSGKRQSPVNIFNEVSADLYVLRFQYHPIPLSVVNNGHTLQANYYSASQGNNVTIGGKSYPVQTKPVYESRLMIGDVPYQLLQFHFHTPSEHTHQGERYPMEVHLVHKSADGNLAVVGILLKRGNANPALQKVLDNATSDINKVTTVHKLSLNATDLLPADKQLFHYSGSLTTPPCSENVNWFVMKTPMEVSGGQIELFKKMIGENARPLQPMHWRSMFVSE